MSKAGRRVILGICAGIAIWGLAFAARSAWVGDDAFISFRYARNLVEGHGLVFNAGERVEGYTNFLWTMILAAGLALNLDPVQVSIVLGIICYAGVAGVLVWAGRRGPGRADGVPVAALAVLLHHDMQIYATSGLETSMFTLLVTAGVLVLIVPRRPWSLRAGILLTLACLTRPEGLLVAGLAGIWLLAIARPGRRALMAYGMPLFVLYFPYWFWRYTYYGWFFPNTYYAKSGDLTHYAQGIRYLWMYVSTYYILLLVPLALALLIRRVTTRRDVNGPDGRALVLAGSLVVLYVFYVVRVGGDFMFARFFVPITPLAFVLLERALRASFARPGLRAAVAGLVLLAVVIRVPPFDEPRQVRNGITDESEWYPLWFVRQARRDGELLGRYVRDPDMVAAFQGTRAMLVYYARIPTAIESLTGLTDEFIAHLEASGGVRPGHDKPAPREYLIRRRACLVFRRREPPEGLRSIRFLRPDGTGVSAFISYYDRDYFEALRGREGVEFVHLPSWLDEEIRRALPGMDREAVENRLGFLDEFYFRYNEDPERRAAFLRRLEETEAPE